MMQRLFEAHEEEMLEGTEVLWEDKLSYYDLIEMKVTEGEASFNSELQNDPIDPDNATFNEEWFDWYEPELMDWKSSSTSSSDRMTPHWERTRNQIPVPLSILHCQPGLDTCMLWMLQLRSGNRTS